jgi:diacylglycerol kinase family enzyme
VGGIAVISNPRSGRNRRNPQLVRKLAYVLGEQGELAQPPSLDELEETVRDLRARGIDTICVNGGDGTLHKVFSALLRVYGEGVAPEELPALRLPRVAILKSGTVNTLARNVGLRLGAQKMLGAVVESVHGGGAMRTVERNLVCVNGRHAGFLFGTGVLYRFMRAYAESPRQGPVAGATLLIKASASALVGGKFAEYLFEKDDAVVTVDGQPWPATHFASVAIGGTDDIGLGFRVFHAASAHPDHVHALGFTGGPVPIVKNLGRIYRGKPIRNAGVLDQVARTVRIEGTAAQGFMMDGDFVEGGQVLEVVAGPRVRFLVPG